MSFKISVPATTANIGTGFDSIGIALNLSLDLSVTLADEWEFVLESKELEGLPTDKGNYIYHIAKLVSMRFGHQNLPSCKVKVTSDIPVARGLGSSSTAVVAGIVLADQLLELNLSKKVITELATEIEGHPDNVVPAIYGGCIIGHVDQEQVDFIRVEMDDNLYFVAAIPDFEFETTYARSILPAYYSHKEAVQASSVANVSVAAILQKDWKLLGKMMNKDLFHQPYRKKLLPDFNPVIEATEEFVYGTYLSGAGPTMISLADKSVIEKLEQFKQDFDHLNWKVLQADNEGVKIKRH